MTQPVKVVETSSVTRHVRRPALELSADSGAVRAAVRRRRRQWITTRIVAPVVVLGSFLTIWQFVSASGWQPDYLLPTPSDIAKDMWHGRAGYWANTWTTLQEILIGFPIAVLLGIVIGAAVGLVPFLQRTAYPFVVASQSIPTLALAPLLVLWFGFGMLPKVILVVQVVFFPIVIATVSGLASVSQQALMFGRTLGASGWQLFVKVRVPASLPYIFSGLKISASYAAVAAVIAEFAGSKSGLGAMMLRANNYLQTETTFGALILVTVIGVGFFALMSLLERICVPWHEKFRKGNH